MTGFQPVCHSGMRRRDKERSYLARKAQAWNPWGHERGE